MQTWHCCVNSCSAPFLTQIDICCSICCSFYRHNGCIKPKTVSFFNNCVCFFRHLCCRLHEHFWPYLSHVRHDNKSSVHLLRVTIMETWPFFDGKNVPLHMIVIKNRTNRRVLWLGIVSPCYFIEQGTCQECPS